jgi:hypothetical protein
MASIIDFRELTTSEKEKLEDKRKHRGMRNERVGHRMKLYKLKSNSNGKLEFEEIPFIISGTDAPKQGEDIGHWEIPSGVKLYTCYDKRATRKARSPSTSPSSKSISRGRSAGGNNSTRRQSKN